MALLVPCPFAPLLLPPPPEPPPLVFLLDLPVECSPHVLSVPLHPPDLSLFLCRFFDSAVIILSVRLVNLSFSVVFVLMVFCDSFTAVCGFNSGLYPARSNSVKFDFGLLIYWPQVPQICIYSLLLDIKIDMVSGWNYESVSCAFASVSWLLIVPSFIVHLSRSLESTQCLIENELIALVGLGSHSSVLRFFSSNYVALAHSFSAVCRVLYVCDLNVEVYVMFSNHWWQFGKKSNSICFLTLHQIYLVSRRLGCSLSRYHDLTAFVAEGLALLGISQLVCKSDCHELSRLLSESWSSDVHWILLAI
ncbi:uncharacterized protein LOC125597864 [Brassica napus]|uniref:uncharacterized protein LOC125597864 n=1 Tax=Brassica napus TaxID=3708 RepID=UPI002078B21B|nr:uncharacterized protein LOC125597864 [Brassica napus]